VNTSSGYIADRTDDYYLTAGRMVGTKRVDILIEACNRLGRRLLVVGAGREKDKWRALAGPTVEFTGRVSDQQLWDYYARCRAFLFAAEEDFIKDCLGGIFEENKSKVERGQKVKTKERRINACKK